MVKRWRKIEVYCAVVVTALLIFNITCVWIYRSSHEHYDIRACSSKQNDYMYLSATKSNRFGGKVYDILINSYMRSGSSYLGRLLAWHPDTFYWYEPLWNYDSGVYYWGKELLCVGQNKCGLAKNKTRHNLGRVNAIFDNIYKCNFSMLSDAVTDNLTLIHSGKIWEPYTECRKTKPSVSECLYQMEQVCKASRHRATKTVRLTLDILDSILHRHQDVKLIHLFRDPRAIMNSRLTTTWFGLKESRFNDYKRLQDDASDLCNRIVHDFITGVRLKQKYPNRFSFVMFEDLMDNHKSKSKTLFKFYGIEMGDHNNTYMAAQVPEEKYSYKIRKSKNYADWWRLQLSVGALEVIDKSCINAIEVLGYRRFHAEDNLRNLSIKAFSFQDQFKLENIFKIDGYEL